LAEGASGRSILKGQPDIWHVTARTQKYRGRLAPSPTGYLHLGQARTFWIAQQRARENGGTLVLRNEDLDRARCKPQFVSAMFEDLLWFGFEWREGPDCGGNFGPYSQSERFAPYREAPDRLRNGGFLYPCTCSRKDIQRAASAPHAEEDELLYPGTCRPKRGTWHVTSDATYPADAFSSPVTRHLSHNVNWRFRAPDSQVISFTDGHYGLQQFIAGKDFGDFVVWRHDDIPAYQLAVVVDDAAMRITEVVRGADLRCSTARQLLLYRALGLEPPQFYHCPLMTDQSGARLAKRHDALSLRALRERGVKAESLHHEWQAFASKKPLTRPSDTLSPSDGERDGVRGASLSI
jgi:glutamyl-tRNA synthetase